MVCKRGLGAEPVVIELTGRLGLPMGSEINDPGFKVDEGVVTGCWEHLNELRWGGKGAS